MKVLLSFYIIKFITLADSLWQGNYYSPLSYTQDSSGQSDFQGFLCIMWSFKLKYTDFLDSIVHPSNRWSYRSRRDWTQRGREFSYEDRPTHRSSRSSYTRTSLGPLEGFWNFPEKLSNLMFSADYRIISHNGKIHRKIFWNGDSTEISTTVRYCWRLLRFYSKQQKRSTITNPTNK